jgi:hypothetical protein
LGKESYYESEDFYRAVSKLGIIANKETSNPLIFTKDKDNFKIDILFSERFYLEKASRLEATAVYFRRFENRPSTPQVYIYDFTNQIGYEESQKKELHRNIWSSCEVPIYIIITKQKIEIFNATKSFGKSETKPFETIDILKDYQAKKFSFKSIDNGSFWDAENKGESFSSNQTAYEKLVEELERATTNFIKNSKLEKELANRLLLFGILIKYMEERTGKDGVKILPESLFKKYGGAKNFVDVIRSGNENFLAFLNELSRHFNGKVFELEEAEQNKIAKIKDLKPLAQFLDGKLDNDQYVLWSLYSFNHLPVELISSIYEEFLPKKKGVKYTPHYLVKLLIDESMPVENPQENFSLLDPACGSGIFLVCGFKRLVEWKVIQQYNKTKKWEIPELEELKEILKTSVYGVDKEEEAVKLAIFSLSIALCDYLEPSIIWSKLKFPNLGKENIICDDFFHWIGVNQRKFSLVIGNPPFDQHFNSDYANEIEMVRINEGKPEIPRKQIALLFLEEAPKALKEKGLLCLILPAGPLLYNNTLTFRKYLLEKYEVPQILDFTHISRVLFGVGGDIPTAALFLKNQAPSEKPILHITVRRMKASKEKIFFEIDSYDFHYVEKEVAKHSPFIWKTNLLGGGRLFYIIERLKRIPTLRKYLEPKLKNEEWSYGEGFIVGSRSKEGKHLVNKDTLPTKAFTLKGIDNNKIEKLKEEFFDSPCKDNQNIFKAPHILIKEDIEEYEDIPITFYEKDISFKHSVIGIHSPNNKKDELLGLYKILLKNRDLYKFYIFSTSNRILVGKATSLLKQDIDNLPHPENPDDLKLAHWEEIFKEDVLNYYLKFKSEGEKSAIMKIASRKQLNEYSKVFADTLNSVYEKKDKKYRSLNHLETATFVCLSFYYGTEKQHKEQEKVELKEESLQKIVFEKTSRNLNLVRILKIYDDNTIYFIKPKQIRYWLKSIAIRDADETFVDLVNQGY